MVEKTQEQAYTEILLVETRKIAAEFQKFTATVAKLEALVPRIENAIIDQIANCREDMALVYGKIGELEKLAACKKGKDQVAENAWYRSPHWWKILFSVLYSLVMPLVTFAIGMHFGH